MRAVIFDIDGTLLESADVDDRLYRRAVTDVLGEVRFRASLAQYDFVTDSGVLAQILDDNALALNADATMSIQRRFVELLTDHIRRCGPFREIPGARDFLAAVRGHRDYAVGIATGGWRASATLKLSSADFDVADVPLATSDGEQKRSRIMLDALDRLGSRFESVTYYGDGSWDRDACRELGWEFVPVGPALGGISSFVDLELD